MSDLLTIDGGVISAGTGETVRVDSRPRIISGLNLPMAGAVLLHLAFLGLALAASRWGGEREMPPVVHSVRLYNVAEVVAPVVTDERSSQMAKPAVSRMEGRPDAGPSPSPVQEMAAAVSGPAFAENVPVATVPAPVKALVDPAPPGSGANVALAAAAGSNFVPAATVSLAPSAAGAAGGSGLVSATVPPAAPALELAHPLYSANPEPEYPPLARRRGLEGTVVLEVLVEVDGLVGGLTVHHSSGQRLLDEGALKSVKGWRFAPGRRGGEPLAMKVLVPVRFALR